MSADQKVILGIFVIYLALNAIIGIVFSKRQGSKQHVSSEKKFFIVGRNALKICHAQQMATTTNVPRISRIHCSCFSCFVKFFIFQISLN